MYHVIWKHSGTSTPQVERKSSDNDCKEVIQVLHMPTIVFLSQPNILEQLLLKYAWFKRYGWELIQKSCYTLHIAGQRELNGFQLYV